ILVPRPVDGAGERAQAGEAARIDLETPEQLLPIDTFGMDEDREVARRSRIELEPPLRVRQEPARRRRPVTDLDDTMRQRPVGSDELDPKARLAQLHGDVRRLSGNDHCGATVVKRRPVAREAYSEEIAPGRTPHPESTVLVGPDTRSGPVVECV